MRCEIGTMPTNASAMTSRPKPRLRTDARRISRSDSPIGRAMPKMIPAGARRATMIQSPVRRGVPSAATSAVRSTPSVCEARLSLDSGV